MATQESAVPNRGVQLSHNFSGSQLQSNAETAIAAVAAREQAKVQAAYLMAERHPRNWDTVRVRLMQHCERPGFAEIARYVKPVGKKKINGEFVEQYAEGLSARFAEIARQEMTNVVAETSVVYEDDLIRIIRCTVTDVERNTHDAREISIAKAVEKRGKKDNRTGEWNPPDGREVIGNPRINSYGDPVYLVKATEDEIRNRQNSEISKAQRDESLRLIPKDIRDDCEAMVLATLDDPKKVDPASARKKLIDSFAKIGVIPDDLVAYISSPLDRISPAQLQELRGLYQAIKDGEIDFMGAMRRKFENPEDATREESKEEQLKVVKDKTKPVSQRRAAAQAIVDEQDKKADQPVTCTAMQPTAIEDSEEFDRDFLTWQRVRGLLYHLNPDGMSYHRH